MAEYFKIQLTENDAVDLAWNKKTQLDSVVLTDMDIEGSNGRVRIDGYSLASSDINGNNTISTDIPEPISINGDTSLVTRLQTLPYDNFQDVENYIDETYAKTYYNIALESGDDLEFDWSPTAGVVELITDAAPYYDDVRGDVSFSGTVVAVVDQHDNVFNFNHEPFTLHGDDLLARTSVMTAVNDEAIVKVFEDALDEKRQQEFAEVLYEEYNARKVAFAETYHQAGISDFREVEGFDDIVDVDKEGIVSDLREYNNLSSRRAAVSREIDRELTRDSAYVDRNVSHLENERFDIAARMSSFESDYPFLGNDGDQPMKEDGAAPQNDEPGVGPHHLHGVSDRDYGQALSDFGPIDESNIDEFMDELELLRDEGLVR